MNEIIRHEIGRDHMYKIWHRAEGNMILFVHKGTGSIVTPDAVYPLQSGVLCFIGSQVLHHTLPNLNYTYDRSKIFISDQLLDQLSPLLDFPVTPQSILYQRLEEEVEPLLMLMERYGTKGGYLQLLQMLGRPQARPAATNSLSVDRGISYIQQNTTRPLSIDEICRAIHTSKYHFCRTFKSRTGMTVMSYILKTRIRIACTLLEQGAYSIEMISESCGFSSPSAFSRTFKQETGQSPSQYRKSRRKA